MVGKYLLHLYDLDLPTKQKPLTPEVPRIWAINTWTYIVRVPMGGLVYGTYLCLSPFSDWFILVDLIRFYINNIQISIKFFHLWIIIMWSVGGQIYLGDHLLFFIGPPIISDRCPSLIIKLIPFSNLIHTLKFG